MGLSLEMLGDLKRDCRQAGGKMRVGGVVEVEVKVKDVNLINETRDYVHLLHVVCCTYSKLVYGINET